MYLNMSENMVASGEHEKISIGRVLVSVSTPPSVSPLSLPLDLCYTSKSKACRQPSWNGRSHPLTHTLSIPTSLPPSSSLDLRYTVNTEALKKLGWKELVSWEEGLNKTVDWYKQYRERYGNIDSALVAHPSSGAPQGFH